jgi:protein-tyrosine phosphatase
VIDTHCHVLPFLDDGASDWEVSLQMVRTAQEDGISQCIATPHWTGAPGEVEKIRERADELKERLAAESLSFKIHLGNEVILVPRLVEALKDGTALTLGSSNYVLLETAQLEQGGYIHTALFQLQSAGYRVILAHPERVKSWQGYFGDVRDLLQRGCFLQVNAGSLLGGFGKEAQQMAEDLIRLRWVSLVASDAHGLNARPQRLRAAVKKCAQLIGEEAAQALVTRNPMRVLCDEQLPYVDLDVPLPRKVLGFTFWPKARQS